MIWFILILCDHLFLMIYLPTLIWGTSWYHNFWVFCLTIYIDSKNLTSKSIQIWALDDSKMWKIIWFWPPKATYMDYYYRFQNEKYMVLQNSNKASSRINAAVTLDLCCAWQSKIWMSSSRSKIWIRPGKNKLTAGDSC